MTKAEADRLEAEAKAAAEAQAQAAATAKMQVLRPGNRELGFRVARRRATTSR